LASAQMLIKAGANVNASSPDGTPLIIATASGHEDVARLLIASGADTNAVDSYGVAALHYAIWEGFLGLGDGRPLPTDSAWFRPNLPGVVKDLLAHGANPNVRIAWREQRFPKEGGTARNPPDIELGLKGLTKINFVADIQTGNNAFSAAGGGIGIYFTPAIDLITGPVFFLNKYAQPGQSTFMWTVQLDVDIDFGQAEANTTFGVIGVRCWIYKGDVTPDTNPLIVTGVESE